MAPASRLGAERSQVKSCLPDNDPGSAGTVSAGRYGEGMFDHVAIRVFDLAASERFYRTVLGALGVEPTRTAEDRVEWDDFRVVSASPEHPATGHLHIGFVAPSRERVIEFWRVGISAGYEDDGPPGERPQYTPGYYGAFLRDPDGNSAEAVRHDFVRRGGHIDHVWIRVRDLDAASAFYVATMRHTGLREGRRWGQGCQFRGAWATFSLVADGAPATEHLEIAFPAPDRQTVDDFHREAISIGCMDADSPGERTGYGPRCYSTAVLDPNGTRVESVFRQH
jgi:catechol 2,3-dioxygenase-like lactoylglutathione lyase family enzyme